MTERDNLLAPPVLCLLFISMMPPDMHHQTLLLNEALVTHRAHVGPLAGVNLAVANEVSLEREAPVTELTTVRLLPSVLHLVGCTIKDTSQLANGKCLWK